MQEDALERLKVRLLEETLVEETEAALSPALRRAAHEAASLAWVTAYPLLVFPGLFEEKAESARARHVRQEELLDRTRMILAE